MIISLVNQRGGRFRKSLETAIHKVLAIFWLGFLPTLTGHSVSSLPILGNVFLSDLSSVQLNLSGSPERLYWPKILTT